MGGSKNIQTDNIEHRLEPSVSPGSFFKKYTVLTQDFASEEPIFKKYAPPRRDGNEKAIDEPSAEVFDMPATGSTEAIAGWPKRQRPFYVWAGVAAIFILAGWVILSPLLQKHETNTQRTDSSSPAAAAEDTSSGVAANGLPTESPSSGSEASILSGSSNEREKDPSKRAQSPRLAIPSPDFVHNVMLARAREFEDRGMLSRAEEEYRAVAASFPGDRFSQVGLSRVQSALTANRVNEMSRVSRETGLRNFRMSDYTGAERELSAAVDAGRRDTATLYALGMSHLKLGNHAKAELTLHHCIAVSPDYPPALVGLAQASAATGRRDQALSLLQRALELGGGAEFTPAKIRDMIANLDLKRPVPNPGVLSVPTVARSQPAFFARAVHSHDLLLASCKGDLQIVNSVVHFNASTPSHSFHVLASAVSDARVTGDKLRFKVNGRSYRFALNERTARDFLNALVAD